MKDKLAADAIGAIQQCIFSNGFSQGLNFKQRKGKIKPSKLLQIRHFWKSEGGEGEAAEGFHPYTMP